MMMRKTHSVFLWLPVFFLFCLLAESFSVCKNFVYADDSLNAFQQDVIIAKQKYQMISGKMGAVHTALDRGNLATLDPEATALMQDVVEKKESTAESASSKTPKKPKTNWVSSIKKKIFKEKPVSEFKIEAPGVQKVQKKGWSWPSFGTNYENQISEGEALYKVAVSDDKVTLKESVEIGLANNIQLQATRKKIEVAQSKLTEAKRALFPTIQGVVEINGGKVGGDVLSADGSGGLVAGQRLYKGQSRKINVNQPLFYGGELVLTVKQAEENLKSSKAEYQKTKNEYIHNVRTAYFGIVKSEYNVQYQLELYEKANTIYQRIKEEHNQKLISEVEFLNTESQYHQVYFQVESAKNDHLSANMLLHQTLSLYPNEPLPVDLKLNFVPIHPPYEEVLEKAMQNNPDVLIKEYAYSSAQYGVGIYRAKKMPRVDLRGSYGMLGEAFRDTRVHEREADLGKGNVDLEKEWFLGVHASMPLGPNTVEYDQIKHQYGPTVLALTGSEDWRHKVAFNLFDNFSNITDEKGAQATLLQSQSDVEKARNDLTVKVRDEFYNLNKSLIQIDSAMAKVRYQEKQNSILEYLLGVQETTAANFLEGLIEAATDRFSFIQAISDYHLAISGLGVAIGDPDYFETES